MVCVTVQKWNENLIQTRMKSAKIFKMFMVSQLDHSTPLTNIKIYMNCRSYSNNTELFSVGLR